VVGVVVVAVVVVGDVVGVVVVGGVVDVVVGADVPVDALEVPCPWKSTIGSSSITCSPTLTTNERVDIAAKRGRCGTP
jgi:hypothetical protein